MSEELIFNWLEQNNKDGIIPAENFEKFLKSHDLEEYDQIVQRYVRLGILYEPADGYLHYRGRPTNLPRIEVMLGETKQVAPYEFVKLAATISRDLLLDEDPLDGLAKLQSTLQTFLTTDANLHTEEREQPLLSSDQQNLLESLPWQAGKREGREWVLTNRVPERVLSVFQEARTRYVEFGLYVYRLEGDQKQFLARYRRSTNKAAKEDSKS